MIFGFHVRRKDSDIVGSKLFVRSDEFERVTLGELSIKNACIENNSFVVGILEVKNDPDKGNAKLVQYTPRGKQLNRTGTQLIERIEQDIAQALGEHELKTLKRLLSLPWEHQPVAHNRQKDKMID